MAHQTARRGGTPSDETDHRLLASALRLILDELRRFFLSATADLADHDDRFRCIIGQIQFQHIDEVGAVDGIAANAHRCRLTQDNSCGLMHCLRSEEHTSELQSLIRTSYAVFCLRKKKNRNANV